jgi:hypothetical protein
LYLTLKNKLELLFFILSFTFIRPASMKSKAPTNFPKKKEKEKKQKFFEGKREKYL